MNDAKEQEYEKWKQDLQYAIECCLELEYPKIVGDVCYNDSLGECLGIGIDLRALYFNSTDK